MSQINEKKMELIASKQKKKVKTREISQKYEVSEEMSEKQRGTDLYKYCGAAQHLHD